MLNLLSNASLLGLFLQTEQPVTAGFDKILHNFVTAIIFVILGLIVFAIAFFIVVKVAPFSVKKEIEDDQNTALAIIIGAIIIGVALIISAAIQGN
jgi:putative membrane protein